MLVHSVYFWLRNELTDTERDAFRKGLEGLKEVSVIETYYSGSPAPSPKRPVLVDDYDFALIAVVEDVEALDIYVKSAIHQAFLQQFSGYWTKIQVFDLNP